MIIDNDRSKWFGASDTSKIMGSWQTKTFALFWAEKLGLLQNNYTSVAMKAGNAFEHRILEVVGVDRMDRQIKIPKLRLRVNLDGEDNECIYEVKTHKGLYKVTSAHWQQAQVEMFAAKKMLDIVSYRLTEEDYNNFFNPIDQDRLDFHPIEYDKKWIETEYLPRLKLLRKALRKGVFPV